MLAAPMPHELRCGRVEQTDEQEAAAGPRNGVAVLKHGAPRHHVKSSFKTKPDG